MSNSISINTEKKLEKFLKSYHKGVDAEGMVKALSDDVVSIEFVIGDPILAGYLTATKNTVPQLPQRNLTISIKPPSNVTATYGYVKNGACGQFRNVFKLYENYFGPSNTFFVLKMTNEQTVEVPAIMFMNYLLGIVWNETVNNFLVSKLVYQSRNIFSRYSSMLAGYIICLFFKNLPAETFVFGLRKVEYKNQNVLGSFELYVTSYNRTDVFTHEKYLKNFSDNTCLLVDVGSGSFFVNVTRDNVNNAIFGVNIDKHGFTEDFYFSLSDYTDNKNDILNEVRNCFSF